MRVITAVILLSCWTMQTVNAQAPTSGQKPFHMPASEKKAIAEYPAWTAPQKPVRVYANTWYVGPRGLGVYLVTASTGHVLIDGGVPGDAALIEANIRALGFDLPDINWILNTHAHYDHAGDIAQLAHDTGAQVIASAADAPLLERGGRDDPQYQSRFPYRRVHVDRTVNDGEVLHLGKLAFTAHLTPGHTRGNTTWTWMSCSNGRCLHIVDVGSLSAPGYKLLDNPEYPNVIEDFRRSFLVVAGLKCDIPVSPHPQATHFWARVSKRRKGDTATLTNPAGCRDYARSARKNFDVQLAKQRTDGDSAE